MMAIGFMVFWGCIVALLVMSVQRSMRIIKYNERIVKHNKMSKWEKLNKEFDDALDTMSSEDWDKWESKFKEKQFKKK